MDLITLNYYLSPFVIGFLSLIILFVFLFRPSKFATNNTREPPLVAGAWPILGHINLLSGSQALHRVLGAVAEKYGPIFTIKLGTKPTLVLSNWEMAKECFTKNDAVVSSRPKLVAVELLTYNQAMFGFAPYGQYWRELRKITTLEIFSSRRVEQLRQFRESEVQASIKDLFNFWSNTKNESNYVLVEMKQWFAQLTFNMILRMVVGKRYFRGDGVVVDEKGKRCIKALGEFMHFVGVFTVGDVIPCLRWFSFGGHEKAMKETAKELDEIVSGWLEEHRRNMRENVGGDQDFMSMMLSLMGETAIHGFDDDTIIKATTLNMILGAMETTSVTLTWAICLILRNPRVLEQVKKELDIQIGKKRCITESDISNLIYLQAIVKETLRLYPAGPLSVPREFTENCTLGGYNIKKGTILITNVWKIQTDPNVWSEPLEFIPERFITTHKDLDVKGHDFEFIPFGSGRRKCPGISFGLRIVHLSLASFLHSFDILNPSIESIDMSETLGLSNIKTTPLEILIKPRLSPPCYESL